MGSILEFCSLKRGAEPEIVTPRNFAIAEGRGGKGPAGPAHRHHPHAVRVAAQQADRWGAAVRAPTVVIVMRWGFVAWHVLL